MSLQQLLLQAGDVETNPGTAQQCGVCRKSTTAKAMICCTCQRSIHQSCSGMTRTMPKQWRQTNDYQCPNCRTVPNSQILCCKCKKGFRLNHNRATCGVSNATAHLKCTVLSRREREHMKQGLRSWSCYNQPATMTMQNSDLLHPLHQPAMKSFVTRITIQSQLNFTCSECYSDQEIKSESNLYHVWSIPSPGLHLSAKMREG